MGVAKPDKAHYSRNMSMMWGADPVDGLWASVAVDSSGFLYEKSYVKDAESLEWVPAVKATALADYKLSDMATGSDPSYFGYVDADGNWYIMKLTDSTGQARYVKGASGYTTAWTGRAGQTYGYYDAIF